MADRIFSSATLTTPSNRLPQRTIISSIKILLFLRLFVLERTNDTLSYLRKPNNKLHKDHFNHNDPTKCPTAANYMT